jgi:hypothetical protein
MRACTLLSKVRVQSTHNRHPCQNVESVICVQTVGVTLLFLGGVEKFTKWLNPSRCLALLIRLKSDSIICCVRYPSHI